MSFNICGRRKSESASLTDEEGDGFGEFRDDVRKCESLCFGRTLWLISSQTSFDYKTCFCFSLQTRLCCLCTFLPYFCHLFHVHAQLCKLCDGSFNISPIFQEIFL